MHEYDIELISLLQNNLKRGGFNEDKIPKKDVRFQYLKQSSPYKGVNSSINCALQDEITSNNQSYLLPLLASEYPNKLLSEYRSLDLELQKLRSSVQRSTLYNSTKLIKRNKQVVTEIRKKFIGFEKRANVTINHFFSIVTQKSNSSQSILLQKLSQFRKLTILRNILKLIVELIELPKLIESFVSANMTDDALDTLEYFESTIKLLEASISYNKVWQNEENSFISTLIETTKHKMELVKDSLYSSIKSRLNFDQQSLLNTVEIIGHLRRLITLNSEITKPKHGFLEEICLYNKISSESDYLIMSSMLAKIFLKSRSEFIDIEYRNKSNMLSKLNCCASLKCAITLFNSLLPNVISTFNSLFSSECDFSWLSNSWLNYYMNWFVCFCKKSLTLVNNKHLENKNLALGNRSIKSFSQKSLSTKTIYVAQFDLNNVPITFSSCQDLYLQIYNVFSFSKPILLITISFLENYMVEYYRKMLEFCLSIFSFELREFDWSDEIQTNNMRVNQIRPFSILKNEFANILNEIKQCPLKSLEPFILDLTDEFLSLILIEIEDLRNFHISNSNPQIESWLAINIDKITSIYNTEIIPYILLSVSSIYSN
ncbi:hypothetical protein [Cryptosporidium parvum Iowa II]|uniref:Uncharacterized protein n=2 Tax=Cryptosporidium parvum TaxID=5807 RepID=Q5CTS8_CRYPI|nr:hypothetical protein [Cryptosporidium parvum Iowa II]EAK88804.1 hypothetical protein cgd2_1720 [Cryptosporidium parvum Iowa II]QOY43061.1 Uncharacterized protein CPATCC_0029100 [Cryptosporidium parvum]WKS76468.1 hypothetical protein CPCDC_2g1720 [Cryptosporidium sp. 43IA8]WRK30961.1 Uncharacterized protein cpbgf_2001720 [Cryptosporidium parvum]|eukprot:QOY43061.1 hypothetical protein CPATCC_000768 [Cryptosporidium parvum]